MVGRRANKKDDNSTAAATMASAGAVSDVADAEEHQQMTLVKDVRTYR